MAKLHVIGALRDKRADVDGTRRQLEQQRVHLVHLDATMQPFDPNIGSKDIRAKRPQARTAWFHAGGC